MAKSEMSAGVRKLLEAATARVIQRDDGGGADDAAADPGRWSFETLCGRLVELSAPAGSATLSAAVELVCEAQRAAEPAAWIMFAQSSFYPPDMVDGGVDLAALVIVRISSTVAALRAAERLLRSGAFGLVVLDLCSSDDRAIELPIAHQGRLVTLAQTHHAAVVCITEKPAESPSLGSLISLRAEAVRLASRDRDHDVTLRVLKDKRHGPGWSRTRKLRGPPGY